MTRLEILDLAYDRAYELSEFYENRTRERPESASARTAYKESIDKLIELEKMRHEERNRGNERDHQDG